MKKGNYSLRARLFSFRYAFSGLIAFFRNEPNAAIHFLAAVAAIILGLILKINATEWVVISFVITLVFITELINSAVEKIADLIEPEMDPDIKQIKDYAAAAVLVSAVLAVVAGGLIFVPKLIHLL